MGTSANQEAIERLHEYLDSGWYKKAYRSNPEFAKKIANLTTEKIGFGKKPTYIQGYMEGNCTAVGEKEIGDTKYQRTISLDFTSKTYTFIDNESNIKLSKYAHEFFKGNQKLHKYSERASLADACGKELARQDLSDLNFGMTTCRLNRHHFIKTESYDLPVWPMYADLDNKAVFLGYWIEDGKKVITDFKISVPLTKKQIWILIAIFGAIILSIILFFLLQKISA